MLLSLIIALAVPVRAQDEEREVALPFVTLVQPPEAPKLEVAPLSAERIQEIEELIRNLSGATRKDLGINSRMHGSVFVPVGEFGMNGDWTGKKVDDISEPVRRLIEIGPDALPFLLEALEDDARTEIPIQSVETMGAIAGGMAFDERTHGNPVNPLEQSTLALNRYGYSSIRPQDEFSVAAEMESYRVKVGDVCFVIIGHIVGRDYNCLSSPHVKSSGVQVSSPVHRKKLRGQIRKIWDTKTPRQRVLESLLLDFSTHGILQWKSLDFWHVGNDFQIESTKRLLYYYPDFAVPVIVARITNLKTTEDLYDDCIRNGVYSGNFVDAIAWSDKEEIKSALAELGQRAKEAGLIQTLKRAGIQMPDNTVRPDKPTKRR